MLRDDFRPDSDLDVIVEFEPGHAPGLRYFAMERELSEILGRKVPKVKLAVAPGRDVARLIEVAALNQKLRSYGHDTAVEFNQRLIKTMQRDAIR